MELNCNQEQPNNIIVNQDDESESYLSSDGLEIDIPESPVDKSDININDKNVLEDIEEEIERQLDEKAVKSNLSARNVKNILKHVITNEHVLAMVRHTTEENQAETEPPVFEPKLTRAKAKELFKIHNVPTVPLTKPKPNLGVHILINEELSEDSDDDEEYIPPKAIKLKSPSSAAATATHDTSTQTNWSEEGECKAPAVLNSDAQSIEIENIALRTRSKLSLNDTPLEVIEETLVPPDITTDMYDLECDDDDWRDFIKQFTRPLEEAVPPTQEDDDEADPEYNVLADEDMDAVDLEELRQDRGVKVTKKELNNLVAELLEFSETFTETKQLEENSDNYVTENTVTVTDTQEPIVVADDEPAAEVICEFFIDNNVNIIMNHDQSLLFEQQMRQHVQMLAQNFVLTYEHPILDHMAEIFKDMLLAFHELSKYKTHSAFNAFNLSAAVEFVKEWENMYKTNDEEIKATKLYVEDVVTRSKIARQKCNHDFIPTFPPLILKKISESCAFLYPSLLPKIPFCCDYLSTRGRFLRSENELIALGLEQFYPYLENHEDYKYKKKTKFGTPVRVADVSYYISKYMMPHKEPHKIHSYIKHVSNGAPNPIKYYFKNKKAPLTLHYVAPLDQFGAVPPSMRPAETLPYQWREFLYPETVAQVIGNKKVDEEIQSESDENDIIKEKNEISSNRRKCEVTSSDFTIKDNYSLRTRNVSKLEEKRQRTNRKKSISKVELFPKSTDNLTEYILENEQPKSVSVSDDSFKLEELVIIPKNQLNERTNTRRSTHKKINIYNKLHTPRKSCRSSISDFSKVVYTHKNITPTIKNFKFNSSVFKKIKSVDKGDDMLPSMPVLFTPLKNNIEIEKTAETEKESQKDVRLTVEHSDESENVILDSENETESKKDDEDEINALMVASSTMQHKNRRLQANSTKKAKQIREYNATLSMLCPEDPNTIEEKAKNFAQAFYDKVQERLEKDFPLKYKKFMEVLSEHDESVNSVSELYEKIESVLSPKHPDLCEEFLTFLTPEQAKQIGKLVPHFMLSNMSLFLRKLEIYYSNQPAQLRRIYNSLTELADIPDVTMEKVRSTVLPLLKGNSLLIDWFLQMFPHETPPESLMTDWEQPSCDDGDDVEDNEKLFEMINLPEVEDPYGGPNCICKCHKIDDEMYASRARHCIPCGTKFLQGRVYVQTGKGLRLAHVSFNNTSSHNKRLNVKPITRTKRKSETCLPKVLLSPTKQDEEPRHSNESEEDINTDNIVSKKIKSLKQGPMNGSPKLRKKQTVKPVVKLVKTESKPKDQTNKSKNKSETGSSSKKVNGKPTAGSSINKITKKQDDCSTSEPQEKINVPLSNDSNINNDEEQVSSHDIKTEITEKECSKVENNELENDNTEWETKGSPGHSVESMDTCEESSQDTLDAQGSDSDNDSINEVESVTSDNSDNSQLDETVIENENLHSWTRDEDKIILQTFEEHGYQNVFNDIRQLLPDRTLLEIRQRFRTLMSLLQEIASEISD